MERVSGTTSPTKDEPARPNDLFTTETTGLSEATRPQLIRLYDGDRFDLRIEPVHKRIHDAELRMLGYTIRRRCAGLPGADVLPSSRSTHKERCPRTIRWWTAPSMSWIALSTWGISRSTRRKTGE